MSFQYFFFSIGVCTTLAFKLYDVLAQAVMKSTKFLPLSCNSADIAMEFAHFRNAWLKTKSEPFLNNIFRVVHRINYHLFSFAQR